MIVGKKSNLTIDNWREKFVNRFDRHEDFDEIYEEITGWIEELVESVEENDL